MSWEDQGRQEHGWFGHGTAPPKLKPDEESDGNGRSDRFGPNGLDQRLHAIGHTAIAALPRTLRHHPAARYDEGPALDQLVTTMRGWVRGLLLDRAEFARRYFGRAANDPVANYLWQAAKFAAVARNEAELRAGTEHLAAAMQAEGLDRWRQFMNDAQQRATAAAHLPVPALNGGPKPATPKATNSPAKAAASGQGRTNTVLPALDVTPPGSPIAAASPDPYASSNVGGNTVRLGAVTLSHTSQLGDLSMRYETGYSPGHEGKAAGVVSNGADDPGGVSYGAYQFASSKNSSQQVQAFLKNPEGALWADRFKGMDPTQPDGAFAREWKNVAINEPDKFFQAQHDYIKRTHYDPVVQKVQHATSLDIDQRSRALQNVVWSMSVQHGRAASLVIRAVQQAGSQGNLSNAAYDRKLINQLYAVRNAYVDAQGRPNLKIRYTAEQHDALRDLGGGGP